MRARLGVARSGLLAMQIVNVVVWQIMTARVAPSLICLMIQKIQDDQDPVVVPVMVSVLVTTTRILVQGLTMISGARNRAQSPHVRQWVTSRCFLYILGGGRVTRVDYKGPQRKGSP